MTEARDRNSCVSVPYLLGSVLAVVLSWEAHHAVLRTVVHGLLSWFYVIYYVVVNWSRVRLI